MVVSTEKYFKISTVRSPEPTDIQSENSEAQMVRFTKGDSTKILSFRSYTTIPPGIRTINIHARATG